MKRILHDYLFEPTTRSNLSSQTAIADFGNPVSRDYLEWLKSRGDSVKTLSMSDESAEISKLVIFIRGQLLNQIDVIIALVKTYGVKDVTIVSSCQSYFTPENNELEKSLLHSLKEINTKAVIFRCGHIISDRSIAKQNLQRFAFLYPLIPDYLRSCCVAGETVFQAISTEQNSASPRSRIIALLGTNQPWQEFLQDNFADTPIQLVLRSFSLTLSFFAIGHLLALLLNWLIELKLVSQSWNLKTIKPKSLGELISLINKYNFKYVQVVGYNNSTNHFGSRNRGKTVISTVNCDRTIQTAANTIKVDCGVTVYQIQNFLAKKQQELRSIPNYSYVSMGTTFFVPIHGNSLESTIVADNITKVILYEPKQERFIVASRDTAAFQKYIFNPASGVVLLRLYVLVKPKDRYFLHKENLTNPSSQVLLAAFHNNTATNIDIRKSNAQSQDVCINKYYSQPSQETESEEFKLPRDGIGNLWDRLEQKPLISWLLLHAPNLYLFWNVEVFLSKSEFAQFWEAHSSLPILKIELRYKKQNPYLNSPFRESDRIAVDFIVLRKHRQAIKEYFESNFAPLYYHLGKHHKTFS